MSRFGSEIDRSFVSMASSFKRPRPEYEHAGDAVYDYRNVSRPELMYREIPVPEYAIRDRISSPLPVDATSTLFVKNLPTNCLRREAAHIFRPFRAFKDVRLVSKDLPRGETRVFCFVEFETPSAAATALEALQGYKLDKYDVDSPTLAIEFGRSNSERGIRKAFGLPARHNLQWRS